MSLFHRVGHLLLKITGGPARARVVGLFAAVFALDNADLSAVGAMSAILQRHFGIDKEQLGLLLTASAGSAGVATLVFGWLVDRTRRVRLLGIVILAWAGLMVVEGLATGYVFLLVTRIGLGIAIAVAAPAVASLVGDYFPIRERAGMYGLIISGELIGTAVGFGISGELATVWWRLGFWVLALAAPFVAWGIFRLPEPARGGASWIEKGQHDILPAEEAARQGKAPPPDAPAAEGAPPPPPDADRGRLRELVVQDGVEPSHSLVEHEDPGSVWWAFGYVLRVPTNLVLIIASALGYYFFAGVRTFGIEYFQDRFAISHGTAILLLGVVGAGGLAGVYPGGRLADHLIAAGHLLGRVWVATGAYLTVGVFMIAALLIHGWIGVALFFLGAFALGATSPPLDSARLDIMPPRLWGRAESVRVVLRKGSEAIAPFIFGLLATDFGGGYGALQATFEIMVIPLFVSGLIGLITFRTYPRDVATAEAAARRDREKAERRATDGRG